MNIEEKREKWQSRIEMCIDSCKTTEWENEFLDSIQIWLSKDDKNILSWKQEKCLIKIYERIYLK